MTLLLLSVVVLALGPIFYRAARTRSNGLALIDGFVVVAISGLVLLTIVPESVRSGGWWALLFCAVGLLGPTLLEQAFRGAWKQTHAVTLAVAVVGVGFHSLLDGVALNMTETEGSLLPLAVILHRFPVGLTLWWLLRPMGRAAAGGVLALVALTTTVGFFLGPDLVVRFDGQAVAWFQALVAGSLLHVVLHRGAPIQQRENGAWYEGIGSLAAVALLGILFAGGDHNHGGGAGEVNVDAFLGLALESAGPLLLGYLLAGLVAEMLPTSSVRWMSRGGSLGQSLRGVIVGLPLPVCSCGVVPLYRALIRRGVPATAAMAFLIATPELGLDAVILSIPLLGTQMTVVRVIGAGIVALAVGWLVGRRVRAGDVGSSCGCGTELGSDAPLPQRLRASLRTGLGEIVDDTAAWILVGLALAAMIQPLLRPEWFAAMPPGLDVLVFGLLGLPVYVCASAATPLVAVLLLAGVSPGAALAFLLTGPATNLTTVGVLSNLHGRRVALTFAISMIAIAVGLGYVVNLALPSTDLNVPTPTAPEEASLFQWLCLVILGLLFAFSLLRLGARRFFVEKILPDPSEAHADAHSH
jgi:uncharacterized membrane protein YraQ (UPF0718 family)